MARSEAKLDIGCQEFVRQGSEENINRAWENRTAMREDLLKGARELANQPGPEVGDERPPREGDRGLLGSRHARLADHIEAPEDELSLEQAEQICGEVTRAWLGDFAPALLLVGAASRRRLQAVLTLTRTCIDFALQPGVEGERMAALNRLQFELEEALDGKPRGQPAYLLVADEEVHTPWSRDAWDRFFDRVRHMAMLGTLNSRNLESLAKAVAEVATRDAVDDLAAALSVALTRVEAWRMETDGPIVATAHTRSTNSSWGKFSVYVRSADDYLRRQQLGSTRGFGLLTRIWLLLGAKYGRQ